MPALPVYRLLPALSLLLVGAGAPDAQERFRSAAEFREEIARLDALVVRSNERLTQSEARSEDLGAELASLREMDPRDLARRRGRLDELAANQEAHQRSRREIRHELDSTMLRRSALLAKHRGDLEPTFLQEVELSVFDPRDRAHQSLYLARWRADAQTRSREEEVLALLQVLEQLEGEALDLERYTAAAEQQFRTTSGRWQMRRADFETHVGAVAPVTNVAAEVADVAVSVIQGGTAALLFEGAYRPLEAVLKGAPASRLPSLSAEILAARAQLEQAELQEVMGAIDHQRTLANGADEPDASRVDIHALIDAVHRDSTVAGLAASSILANTVEEAAAEIVKQLAELRSGALAEALAEVGRRQASFREFAPEALERSMRAVLVKANETMQQPKYMSDWGKGLGTAVVVTAGKVALKGLSEAESQRIFNDMAVLELEWFLRRRAYVAASRTLRERRGEVAAVLARLNALFKQRDDDAQGRREMETGAGVIVLGEWHWKQQPAITLTFTGSVPSARMRVGRDYRSSGMSRHSLQLSSPGDGPHSLEVEAESVGTQFHDLHDGFDADPATFARLRPGLTWTGRESGPDRSHRLTFASPALTILNPAAEAFVAGARVDVSFIAPSTAREDAWIGVVRPDTPREIPKDGPTVLAATKGSFARLRDAMTGGRGKVSLKAPTSPGRYELRLYDREAEGVSMATLPLCVREPGIAGLYDEECSTLIGDWILRGPRPGVPGTKMTIALAAQPDRFASIAEIAGIRPGAAGGRTVYDIFTAPRQAGEPPRLRCARDGKQLQCRFRITPAPTANCPAPPPGWAEAPLTVEVGDRIEGYARWTTAFSDAKCAFEPLRPGINPPPFRIELVRDTPARPQH